MQRMTEVVVVGAGPVGLAVGAALRRHGREVVVVDRLAEGANTSRAAVIHAGTLESLERIGVSARLVDAGLALTNFAVRQRSQMLFGADFSRLATKYPFVLMLSQAETERILLERLEELGGSVQRPVTATGLTQSADGVDVTLDSGDVIHAEYVVAADGMHSTIRDLAGIEQQADRLPLSLSLVDVRVDGGLSTKEVGLYFAPEGLLVVAPLPDGSFRLVGAVDPAPERPDLDHAQRLLTERGPGTGAKVTEVVWGSRFRIHEQVADTYRAGRVLLAGDAAHTHSPAGGQGMNLGLRDAIALGDALAQALAAAETSGATSGATIGETARGETVGAPGGGAADPLEVYAARARAKALRVVALSHRLTVLGNVPRPVRPLRNLLLRLVGSLPTVRHELAKQLAGLEGR